MDPEALGIGATIRRSWGKGRRRPGNRRTGDAGSSLFRDLRSASLLALSAEAASGGLLRIEACAVRLLLKILAFSLLAQIGQAQDGSSTGGHAASLPSAPSAFEQTLMTGPWKAVSFDEAAAVLRNRGEAASSRCLALEILTSRRRELPLSERRQLAEDAWRIARDQDEPPALASQALGARIDLLVLEEETGEAARSDLEREAPFLTDLARDAGRPGPLRAQAIRALGEFKLAQGAEIVKSLLGDSENLNRPEIARPACLALMRLEGKAAAPMIAEVLRQTADPSVFGTAAYALGRLQTIESLVALAQESGRFSDTGSCDAALAAQAATILALLRRPEDPRVAYAIRATRSLWRAEQRESWLPLLRALLTAESRSVREAALERLLEAARSRDFETEKQELTAVLPLIEGQPEFAEQARWIGSRLNATRLAPVAASAEAFAPAERETDGALAENP